MLIELTPQSPLNPPEGDLFLPFSSLFAPSRGVWGVVFDNKVFYAV